MNKECELRQAEALERLATAQENANFLTLLATGIIPMNDTNKGIATFVFDQCLEPIRNRARAKGANIAPPAIVRPNA